jgi:hypothetical protein
MDDYRVERHGALAVVRSVAAPDEVQRALKRLDPALFVEQQIGFDQEPVWCVVCDIGDAGPPVTIMEWRDPDGSPIPYVSLDLVDRVARMERDGARLTASAIEKNQAIVEAGKRERRQQYLDMQADIMPSILGKRSVNLPRGQSLRMMRDKARARGDKV